MIRLIEPKDAKACVDIYNYYIENTTVTYETKKLSMEEFAKRIHSITKKFPYIVYEEEGVVLGYGYLNTFNERSAYQWTTDLSIYVDVNAQGKGIGHQIYERIEELAILLGYKKIVSLITSTNENSVSFHQKHGFVLEGNFKNMGYKNNQWLGVQYFTKQIANIEPDPTPVKKIDYPEIKEGE